MNIKNIFYIILLMSLTSISSAENLEKIKFGYAQKSISPIIINFLIPKYLGYYKEEGLDVEFLTLGANATVMASLDQNRIDFGVGVPSFQLPIVAKGEKLPAINFYEYTYPFKWAVAVKPDSSIKSLLDLKGKTIGVSAFGVTDFPVGKALLKLSNLDPEKDVKWLAVGAGTKAGQAVERNDVSALIYFDTGFGQIEASGIKLRYLPLPDSVPKVGGLYISATEETLQKRQKVAIGFARSVAKASHFIQANPRAAAYMFIKLYPEAAPRGKTLTQQIDAISISINKRMPLYSHYDKNISDLGRIKKSEWEDEVEFYGLKEKVKDVSKLFTNNLISEINNFDRQKIINSAKAFVIPAN